MNTFSLCGHETLSGHQKEQSTLSLKFSVGPTARGSFTKKQVEDRLRGALGNLHLDPFSTVGE